MPKSKKFFSEGSNADGRRKGEEEMCIRKIRDKITGDDRDRGLHS